jgi:glycosyltransferase involved in cell wall biosynthesis
LLGRVEHPARDLGRFANSDGQDSACQRVEGSAMTNPGFGVFGLAQRPLYGGHGLGRSETDRLVEDYPAVDLRRSQESQPSEAAGTKLGGGDDGTPPISVFIPLNNRAGGIRTAIDSVLKQSFSDFELIVVDDGSTDGGAAVVEAFDDPRVRLVRQGVNKGANAARNEGIRQARGRIIAFLDSDDVFLPNKLQTVAEAFGARPDLGLIMDSFRKTRRNGGQSDCRNPQIEDRDELIRALFDRRIWKSTSAISVTREAAIEAGLFDEGLKRRQDLDFILRVIRQVPSASLPAVTWVKTFTDDSISADRSGFMSAFLAFWDRHPDYYEDPVLRRGFSLDLARHSLRLAKQLRLGQLVGDLGLVSARIGRTNTSRALVRGAAQLRRLRRHRLHRTEGR